MEIRLILLLTPILFGCVTNGENNKERRDIPYHSYDEVIERTIKWNETFIKEEDNYYIYYFSKTCHFCEEIRNEILDITINNIIPFYFCFEGVQTDEYVIPESTIGISDISNFKIKGFPSLVGIQNKKVSSHLLGKTEILHFIRSVS